MSIQVISGLVRELNCRKALAFNICLLERALPAYFRFQCDSSSYGGGVLRAALAQGWAALESPSGDVSPFVSVGDCERLLPDSEDPYPSDYTSAAIDAIDIACNLLVYLQDKNVKLVVDSIISRVDSIDLYVSNRRNATGMRAGYRVDAMAHPLMLEEFNFMAEDIAFLNTADERFSPLFVQLLERVSTLEYGRLRLQ